MRGRPPISSTPPTQRPGEAHLVVNGKILCGIKNHSKVRYYKDYLYWQNQPDKCPSCLSLWQLLNKISDHMELKHDKNM